jgi:hypothetical protein
VLLFFCPCGSNERFEKYKGRIGFIYENYDYTKPENRLVSFFFVLRRVVFAWTAIIYEHHPLLSYMPY